jgi:hypothetical protein
MGDGAPISQEIKLPTDSAELGKAVLKLDELIGKLGKSERAAKEHGEKHRDEAYKLRHEFGQMGHAAEYAKVEIKDLLEFTGIEKAIEHAGELVEKMVDIGKEAVVSAAAAERMNRVIDNASGGKIAGKENREWLDEFSKKTEFTEAQGEGAFVDLKRSGLSDQQSKLTIKAAADVAAVSKDRDAAFGATIEAFQRLQTMGRVNTRSLMPLGLGVEDFKKLDRFKGMSNEKVSEALGKTDVNKNELFQLIMGRASEKAIGEKAAANADLLGTKLAKLEELPERFYKKLADTKALGVLSKELDGILDKIDPNSPTGQKIFGALEAAFSNVVDLVGQIDFEDVAEEVADALGYVKPALEVVEKIATGIWGVFKGWVKAIDAVVEAIPGMKVDAKSVPKTKEEQVLDDKYAHQREVLREMKRAKGEGAMTGSGPLNSLNAASFDAGKSIPDGVVAGIKHGAPRVAKASSDLGADSHAAFMGKEGIDAHSPSRKFHYGGQMAAEGVALGFESKADRIADAMTTTLGPRVTTGGGGRVATGGRSIHLTIAEGAVQMAVHGGAGGDVAGMVRDELRRSFVPILVDTLENAEDGA